MLRLIEVNEENWLEAARLCAAEDQLRFLDRPLGIIARGYVYASANAKVIGIADEDHIIGLALAKDMDEEPACYDLQQFMIDRRFVNKGYGTQALGLILAMLGKERKYDCVEVCVNKADAPALRVFEKAGFEDTGYIDAAVPDCRNLMYYFRDSRHCFSDKLISDFSDSAFQNAFKQYFAQLEVKVEDWEALFREMNEDGDLAYVRTTEAGEIVGFIEFQPTAFTSWFFEETCGFIREFWIAEEYRNQKHGSQLLALAEKYFITNGIYTTILTTDTAEGFYLRAGYVKAKGCKAKNEIDVFVKHLT